MIVNPKSKFLIVLMLADAKYHKTDIFFNLKNIFVLLTPLELT
jgi:hypothetical protein